jgi:hypothetical protein
VSEQIQPGANGDQAGINGDRFRPPLDYWPVLRSRCQPEDIYRLCDYSRARYGTAPIDTSGLRDAAERILIEVQSALREYEEHIERAAAFELYFAQRWSLDALLWQSSHKAAKETQIRLAGGRPLTICVGSGRGRDVVTIAGTFRITGGGCFRVFEDAKRTSGRMWAQWCPECRPRNGKRNPMRAEERAFKRRVAKLDAERRAHRSMSN